MYLQACLIFRQVRLGNCPHQWQLMRHPRHTRQFHQDEWQRSSDLCLCWWRDGFKMRKGYSVCVIIGCQRPVRVPTVNGCLLSNLLYQVDDHLKGSPVFVESWCDKQADIYQSKMTFKRWNVNVSRVNVVAHSTHETGRLHFLQCTSIGTIPKCVPSFFAE